MSCICERMLLLRRVLSVHMPVCNVVRHSGGTQLEFDDSVYSIVKSSLALDVCEKCHLILPSYLVFVKSSALFSESAFHRSTRIGSLLV